MSEQWYYHLGDEQKGPVSVEEFHTLATAGQVLPQTLVWKDGMPNWVQASTVDGLLPIPTPPVASTPPVPNVVTPPQPGGGTVPPVRTSQASAPVTATAPTSAPDDQSIKSLWSRLSLFQRMQLGGAGVFFLSILLPFWSVTVKADKEASQDQAKKFVEVMKKNQEWYNNHIPESAAKELGKAQRNKEKLTVRLFGFSTGTGILGLFFGLLIGASVLTPLFVSQIKSLDWILALVACFLGFIMFIMSLTWILGSPSANASPLLAQGKSLGPLAVFLASIAVCGGSVLFALPQLKKSKSKAPSTNE